MHSSLPISRFGLNLLSSSYLFPFNRLIDKVKELGSAMSIKGAVDKNLFPGTTFHVMLADDDPDDQELLAEAIADVLPGIKISFVQDGKSLFEQLNGNVNLPDLIIIDLNMPGLNGFECLDGIRENKSWANIPILIYSTSANPEQIDKTYHCGASFYIQKPSSYLGIKRVASFIVDNPVRKFLEQPKRNEFLVKF